MLSAPHGAPQTRQMVPCWLMQSIEFHSPCLFIGNADITEPEKHWVGQFSGPIVCADGGARHCQGRTPNFVIGDGDSWRGHGENVIVDPDQNTNDLEKCLMHVQAPSYVGIGFLGGRWDHSLANLSLMLRYPNLILMDATQSIQACHDHYQGQHEPGETIGIIPAGTCAFSLSRGLKYPLTGLELALSGQVGSSNCCTDTDVEIRGEGSFWLVSNSRIYSKPCSE